MESNRHEEVNIPLNNFVKAPINMTTRRSSDCKIAAQLKVSEDGCPTPLPLNPL